MMVEGDYMYSEQKKVNIYFIFNQVYVYMHTCTCVGAGNRTWVPCKSNKYS